MDKILAGLEYCFDYLDDSWSPAGRWRSTRSTCIEVLTRLQQHGLVLNVEKCAWFQSSVSYLGHEVTASSIKPLADWVETIQKIPLPQTVPQLQTYVGMVNFYRCFLRGTAQVLKPLTDVLKGVAKGRIEWYDSMQGSFTASKATMVNTAELVHWRREQNFLWSLMPAGLT